MTNTHYLFNQLWQDELYTLDQFVLVPLRTTLQDYHVPNNHIVFNFVANVYCRLIGVTELPTLLEQPVLIRLLPYACTLCTVWVFYKGCCRSIGPFFALVATACLVTSIQLYTFGAQVRGYPLQMLLVTIQLMSLLAYKRSPRGWIRPVIIVLTGALLLINLPSSLFYTASLLILQAVVILGGRRPWRQLLSLQNNEWRIWICLLAGFILFCLYFLLLIGRAQVENDPYFYHARHPLSLLLKQPFIVFRDLLDWRYYLLLPLVLSLFLVGSGRSRQTYSLFLAGLFLLPFGLFMLYPPEIVPRTWSALLPVFALLIAHACVPVFPWLYRRWPAFITLLALTVLLSLYCLNRKLEKDNGRRVVTLELRDQYHLAGYHPRSLLDTVIAVSQRNNAAIRLCKIGDEGLKYYLRYWPVDSIAHANQGARATVLIANTHDCYLDSTLHKHYTLLDSGDNAANYYKWYLVEPPR